MDTDIIVSSPSSVVYSGNDMQAASDVLAQALRNDMFADYHKSLSHNTRLRQHNDLTVFADYLSRAQIHRSVDELEHNPQAWRGMTVFLVSGFQRWLEEAGYAIGTINVRLATIRAYCEQAMKADVLTLDELRIIRTVKGKAGKTAANLDESRAKQGIPTRRGHKKAAHTEVTISQVYQIEETSTPGSGKRRAIDQLLPARDELLTRLIFENALRCGEVVALDIENINIAEGTIRFYREKTDRTETHQLTPNALIAAENYLKLLKDGIPEKLAPRTSGPLFTGYHGRISKRAINARVGVLGREIGVKALSPHDARHFWAIDAFRHKNSIDRVISGGGWRGSGMALRYAQQTGIANEGIIISQKEK